MDSIRLTQFSPGAGCGCKISPAELRNIIQESLSAYERTQGPGTRKRHTGNSNQRPGVAGLNTSTDDQRVAMVDRSNGAIEFPQLLVGNESSDDAAVYDIGGGKAVISTTDFFTPIVDDPYDFGRIAATNALSDVYAMGGNPLMAIAILGWPLDRLSASVAGKVLEGARAVCTAAGIPLAGGHSISISEPVFGLAVTGIIDTALIKKNNTIHKGDLLFLTKPLGIGIVGTAVKKGLAEKEHIDLALKLMTRLNTEGVRLAAWTEVHAMTDVTGFGMLGHCLEMVDGSGYTARIRIDDVPLIPGIEKYIAQDCIPGGTYRNFDSYGHRLSFSAADNTVIVGIPEGGTLPDTAQKPVTAKIPEGAKLPDPVKLRLCDPQTSGGLLVAAHPDSRAVLEKEFGAVCVGNIV